MNYESKYTEEVIGWQWLVTIIILGIPVVDIIMYFVWVFSSGTNKNVSNFCKATLLAGIMVIGLVLFLGGCVAIPS